MRAARNVDGMRNVSIDGRVVAMVASTLPLASSKGLRTLSPSSPLSHSFSLSLRVFKPQPGDVQRKESRISLSYRAWMQITGRVDDRQHSWTNRRWESRREWDEGWVSFAAITPATVQLANTATREAAIIADVLWLWKLDISRKAVFQVGT